MSYFCYRDVRSIRLADFFFEEMHWWNDADLGAPGTALARCKIKMPAHDIIFFHARILGKKSSAEQVIYFCLHKIYHTPHYFRASAPSNSCIFKRTCSRPLCPRLAFPKVSLQPPTLRERKNDLRRFRALRRFARRRCARAAWPSRVHEREHRDLCRVFRRVFRRFLAPVRKRRNAICIILQ